MTELDSVFSSCSLVHPECRLILDNGEGKNSLFRILPLWSIPLKSDTLLGTGILVSHSCLWIFFAARNELAIDSNLK